LLSLNIVLLDDCSPTRIETIKFTPTPDGAFKTSTVCERSTDVVEVVVAFSTTMLLLLLLLLIPFSLLFVAVKLKIDVK